MDKRKRKPECHSIDIDAEKLLDAIRDRPLIFNFNLKNHHNQVEMHKTWEEIGQELEAPVSDCRSKWHSLRTSYARYRRELSKMPSGSARKKKVWYLADSMSFLDGFMGPQKPNRTRNPSLHPEDVLDNAIEEYEVDDNNASYQSYYDTEAEASSDLATVDSRKRKKLSVPEIIEAPMTEYLSCSRHEEDANLSFFKSLLPDVKKLDDIGQRRFKARVMELLNSFLDAQEESVLESS